MFVGNTMEQEDWDNACEHGILGLVLAILVFAPLAFGAVDAWAFLVVQGLAIGVLLLWTLRLWLAPRPRLLWPPLCWAVLAFASYAVARCLTADIEYIARQEVIQVWIYAFLFFAIVNNLHRQNYSQTISFALVALAMGISAYAIYQFMTHSESVWNQVTLYPGRGTGTYISPNNLAGFLEMILPLAVAYLLAGRVSVVGRILLAYSSLAIMAGIAVSFSRGGWAAAAAALLFLLAALMSRRQHRLPAAVMLALLMGGGGVFFKEYLSHTHTFVQRDRGDGMQIGQVSLELRRDLWMAGLQMWRQNFWCGVGPAHYNYRFPEYRSERIQRQPDRAHNDYINLLADWGTVGGAIVFAGMGVFVASLWQTRRHVRRIEKEFKTGNSNRLAFFWGGSAGLFALAVHSVVDFNLHIPANALVGVTLLALLSSNLRFATDRFWVGIRLPAKIVASVALLAGSFYLGTQEIRHGRETYWLGRADSLPVFSSEQSAALEKAFAADPHNFQTARAIGECYRMQSFSGGENYEAQARTAMQWYQRGMKLDPYESYNYLDCGMCLDWLDRHEEAEAYFNRADALDPNSYYVAATIGWHYVQAGDYAAARAWFRRSLSLKGEQNPVASNYLNLVEEKLRAAAGKSKALPGF